SYQRQKTEVRRKITKQKTFSTTTTKHTPKTTIIMYKLPSIKTNTTKNQKNNQPSLNENNSQKNETNLLHIYH
ncbi:hypothetical protein L9G16_22905, partial [Shewanella sp. A25]|nr:hypothetical protein [Shewanella shenzhenensis]